MYFPGECRLWTLTSIWSATTTASRKTVRYFPICSVFQSTRLYESSVYCTTRLPCRATDADVDADAMTDVDDEATHDGDDSDVDGDDTDGKVLA